VHVTGEFESGRPGLKYAGLTLPDESKLVTNWPAAPQFSGVSIVEMGKTCCVFLSSLTMKPRDRT